MMIFRFSIYAYIGIGIGTICEINIRKKKIRLNILYIYNIGSNMQ